MKRMSAPAPIHYEGTFCELRLDAPAPGVVLLAISGHYTGEFGSLPMTQLEARFAGHDGIELYIDARRTKAASTEVSGGWAVWLGAHRSHFKHISMLTGSRFIEITAGFVRSFSALEDIMRLYTDAEAFDQAVADSVAAASR